MGSLAFIAHERDSVAAGVGDALDVDDDDRPRGLGRRRHPVEVELRFQLGVPRLANLDDLTAAVQAHDPRWALERAQHDHDPSVLAQVRDRLRATAEQVEVADLLRAEDAQALDRPLGRDVDVTIAAARGSGDEEHPLAADPRRELGVDLLEDLAHRLRLSLAPEPRQPRVVGLRGPHR